jgi:hypothetical protein
MALIAFAAIFAFENLEKIIFKKETLAHLKI